MISAILLAAGQSSRMNGENKLTKEIDEIPLIVYSVKSILGSAVNELIIVLGHDEKLIKDIIKPHNKIKFVYNDKFKDGIAFSIKIGLNNISKKSDAFFICLGDMPNVNQNIYNKMIKSRFNYNKKLLNKNKKEIFVPTYEESEGNPILFSRFMKKKIMEIDDDFGAKKIIKLNKEKTLYIPFKSDGIILDFDTQDDFIVES